jgi:hypothetical protein
MKLTGSKVNPMTSLPSHKIQSQKKSLNSLILSTLLFSFFSMSALGDIIPYKAHYQAEWDLGWFPIRVDAIRELKKINNNDWKLELRADSSVAEFREGTTFQHKDKSIIPLSYYQKRGGLLPNENLLQTFNWKTGIVDTKSEEHKKTKVLHTQPFLHSSLTYQLQLGLDIQEGKQEFSYPVASTRKIRQKDFEIIGEESIKTELGLLDCVVLRLIPAKKDSKEKTKIWLAKDYHYLEVRFWIHEKDGSEYSVEITKGTMDGKPILGRALTEDEIIKENKEESEKKRPRKSGFKKR